METNQQNQDEIEIDLLELLRVLWSKIGYVILAALALGLLMVLVSKVFMKPQYESTTKMYVLSKQDSSSTVTSGDLQASSLLTKDYAELIQSRQVVETVIAQLNLDLTYEEFLNKITVTTQNDTRILSLLLHHTASVFPVSKAPVLHQKQLLRLRFPAGFSGSRQAPR